MKKKYNTEEERIEAKAASNKKYYNCWEDFQLLCGSCNSLKHVHGECICGKQIENPDQLLLFQ